MSEFLRKIKNRGIKIYVNIYIKMHIYIVYIVYLLHTIWASTHFARAYYLPLHMYYVRVHAISNNVHGNWQDAAKMLFLTVNTSFILPVCRQWSVSRSVFLMCEFS